MYEKPKPPEAADHYATLGVRSNAEGPEIKRAFRKLALKHHPDKQAPGGTVDAVKFREAHEAYETLIDPVSREEYEKEHPNIQDRWEKYRRDLADWERRSAAKAEATAQQARSRSESDEKERRRRIWLLGEGDRERRAAIMNELEAHELWKPFFIPGYRPGNRCGCPGCTIRKAREYRERRSGMRLPTQEELAEYMQMRKEEAEQRKYEAMQKRREQQEREAQERMKKEQEKADRIKRAEERKRASKEKVKDARSKEAARRAREQQEKDAQIRMAKNHIREKQEKYVQELNGHGRENGTEEHVLDIGWVKNKSVAKCLFCDKEIKYYSFRCPDGGATACNPCKNKLSRFTPPKQDEPDAGDDEEEARQGAWIA